MNSLLKVVETSSSQFNSYTFDINNVGADIEITFTNASWSIGSSTIIPPICALAFNRNPYLKYDTNYYTA